MSEVEEIVKLAREVWPNVVHFEISCYFSSRYIEPWHIFRTGPESWSTQKSLLSANSLKELLTKLQSLKATP